MRRSLKLPDDAPPELRAYARQLAERDRAERRCLRELVRRAKEDETSLHQAARAVVADLAEGRREDALKVIDGVIGRYLLEVRRDAEHRAMNPRRRTSRTAR